jgi:hypothetical protein
MPADATRHTGAALYGSTGFAWRRKNGSPQPLMRVPDFVNT